MPALLQRLNQASPPAHRNKRKIPAFRNFRLFYKMSNPAHYLEALTNAGFINSSALTSVSIIPFSVQNSRAKLLKL
jgi:hypothetical protein